MDDAIARKLAQLGLDRRGVVSPMQAAAAAAADAREARNPDALAGHRGLRRGRELVCRTRIAGMGEPGVDADAVAGLEPGDRLSLMCEAPAGGADHGTACDLRILDANDRVVGRVPRESAADLARLAAAGEELSARVTSIDGHRDWTDVEIDVFAREGEAQSAHDAADRAGERRL